MVRNCKYCEKLNQCARVCLSLSNKFYVIDKPVKSVIKFTRCIKITAVASYLRVHIKKEMQSSICDKYRRQQINIIKCIQEAAVSRFLSIRKTANTRFSSHHQPREKAGSRILTTHLHAVNAQQSQVIWYCIKFPVSNWSECLKIWWQQHCKYDSWKCGTLYKESAGWYMCQQRDQ